jgi:hypothetical protein
MFSIILFVLSLALPSFSMAGSSESGNSILSEVEVVTFANRVQQDLASRGASVAIVSRMGRNPNVLPAGVDYTHVAFWVFSQTTRADGSTGQGYQVYNLYQKSDDETRSSLVQDSPADFFAGAFSLDAGVIIPDVRVQEKLLNVIASPTYAALHNPHYSILANPNSSQFQNCTEHTLDVLMAGLYGTSNVPQIKANISAYFQPQHIQIGGLKRALAPAASLALTTSDHGATVSTATFGSIARFMDTNGLASLIYRITPDQLISF